MEYFNRESDGEWLAEFSKERSKAMKKLLVGPLSVIGTILLLVALIVAGFWYITSPTAYGFGNGAELTVPCGAVSADKRSEGCGIVVESGVNVTVYNNSDEWRTLTVSYRGPNDAVLYHHAFEDLPPKSSKTFGADPDRYMSMYISVSDYAQKKRDKN